MSRRIPLFTLSGVPNADIAVHPFTTEDGLGLSMLRFHRAESKDVVLIVHGLTTSSDMSSCRSTTTWFVSFSTTDSATCGRWTTG